MSDQTISVANGRNNENVEGAMTNESAIGRLFWCEQRGYYKVFRVVKETPKYYFMEEQRDNVGAGYRYEVRKDGLRVNLSNQPGSPRYAYLKPVEGAELTVEEMFAANKAKQDAIDEQRRIREEMDRARTQLLVDAGKALNPLLWKSEVLPGVFLVKLNFGELGEGAYLVSTEQEMRWSEDEPVTYTVSVQGMEPSRYRKGELTRIQQRHVSYSRCQSIESALWYLVGDLVSR